MRALCCWLALLALGCAAVPEAPAPGTSRVYGQLRLVPREGANVGPAHGAASYGDRRFRDVSFVDYSHPGFAVVYADGAATPAGRLELAIRATRVATHIEPREAAVGAAGRVVLRNEADIPHLVSYPAAGFVRRLQPGESLELDVPRAGEQAVFVLGVADAVSTIFAAPGPFAVVAASGHYELPNLPPGPRELFAWHPRFPPARRRVELAPDESVEVDFELGVGLEEHAGDPAEHAHGH